ncbi:nucleotide exchange factor GrpE [Nonomuraea fuscirosea]|uniref:nucleotide exchange factor GrpE n=1 Tax=Nonomuraea fuscirosea TaxID=1291556 RepID=UPI0033CA3440
MSDNTPVAAVLDQLTEEIKVKFKNDMERANHREEIIDRLFEENKALRHGLLQEALTPVRSGLYRLYDLAGREAARHHGAPGGDEHLASLFDAIAAEVAEVLARTGAELLDVSPGDPYDSARHRATRTGPGPEGQVMAVVAAGFHLGERVLRKADVVVGKSVDDRQELSELQRKDG